jgi:hypothetical protein
MQECCGHRLQQEKQAHLSAWQWTQDMSNALQQIDPTFCIPTWQEMVVHSFPSQAVC